MPTITAGREENFTGTLAAALAHPASAAVVMEALGVPGVFKRGTLNANPIDFAGVTLLDEGIYKGFYKPFGIEVKWAKSKSNQPGWKKGGSPPWQIDLAHQIAEPVKCKSCKYSEACSHGCPKCVAVEGHAEYKPKGLRNFAASVRTEYGDKLKSWDFVLLDYAGREVPDAFPETTCGNTKSTTSVWRGPAMNEFVDALETSYAENPGGLGGLAGVICVVHGA